MKFDMTSFIKYPGTRHFPWSEGASNDDVFMQPPDHFLVHPVVMTVKMDGENTSMYRDGIHARSLDSSDHPSRHWVKNFHAKIAHEIPEGWRLCGENLYAAHTIQYDNLESYFMLFSVWNEHNVCLSWEDTTKWANRLGMYTVPVMFEGILSKEAIMEAGKKIHETPHEGYVIRVASEFRYEFFEYSVGKYVKKEFRNRLDDDNKHWLTRWDEKQQKNWIRKQVEKDGQPDS